MDPEEESGCVLLVDDDPEILEAYCLILSAAGYKVRCAKDGAEALSILRSGECSPCLIVLDLMMPRVDGFEFLARRSRDQRLAAVPVIVCSAISDLSGFRIGGDASAWLPKPVNVQALLHQARIWSRTDRPQ